MKTLDRIFDNTHLDLPHITPSRTHPGEWELRSRNLPMEERCVQPVLMDGWWTDVIVDNTWMPDPIAPLESHNFAQVCRRAKEVYQERVEQTWPIERRPLTSSW